MNLFDTDLWDQLKDLNVRVKPISFSFSDSAVFLFCVFADFKHSLSTCEVFSLNSYLYIHSVFSGKHNISVSYIHQTQTAKFKFFTLQMELNE